MHTDLYSQEAGVKTCLTVSLATWFLGTCKSAVNNKLSREICIQETLGMVNI